VDIGAKLSTNDPNLWVPPSTNELTHNYPLSFEGDSAVWIFQYTAPTKLGVTHIYAAGNAVNLNDTADNGDLWNKTVYTLTVVSAASVVSETSTGHDMAVVPNPSSGRFTLRLGASAGLTGIEVTDVAGHVVFNKDIQISSAMPLDLTELANGTYFLHARPHVGEAFVRRIVIQH